MLPTINEFVSKYGLENFVVVADSGLMNNANIAELEAHGYKYIIGAKIKNESQEVKNWILEQPKCDCQMVEYDKGGGRRLLVGYTDDRAKKDAYNREKGIRRLEKAYKHGALTKGNINKRDTPHVSLYTQTHRSPYMHLLCGFESIQGTGAHAESLRD